MFPSILIVDDEPTILQSLSGLLTDEGFEVITANNGYEALKIIDAEAPDLVLLDIWMPGIDGIETLKEIKKSTAALPVHHHYRPRQRGNCRQSHQTGRLRSYREALEY